VWHRQSRPKQRQCHRRYDVGWRRHNRPGEHRWEWKEDLKMREKLRIIHVSEFCIEDTRSNIGHCVVVTLNMGNGCRARMIEALAHCEATEEPSTGCGLGFMRHSFSPVDCPRVVTEDAKRGSAASDCQARPPVHCSAEPRRLIPGLSPSSDQWGWLSIQPGMTRMLES
jgi:hypothetical protein